MGFLRPAIIFLAILGCILQSSAADKCDKACPRNYDPVCADDDHNYNNKCLMDVAACKANRKLRVVRHGLCAHLQNEDEPIHRAPFMAETETMFTPKCRESMLNGCTREYDPVCGEDLVTYSNECQLCVVVLKAQKAGENKVLRIMHRGECNEEDARPKPAPMRAIPDDVIEPQCLESVACPRDYNPVCGTDGKTYPNECLLCAQRRKQAGLKIAKRGECLKKEPRSVKLDTQEILDKEPECNEMSKKGICPMNLAPVCGSDGVTYDNECMLCHKSATLREKGLPGKLLIHKRGEC